MAIITIKTVVPNISEVLEVYNRIKVYRSATGETGSFDEITTTPTRVALEAGITAYEYVDGTGSSDDWYCTSYFHTDTLAESSLSPKIQGAQGSAIGVLTPDELKTYYLYGVDLTDNSGAPFPDSLFAFHIEAAVATVERELDIPILPRTFTEAEPDTYDFVNQDFRQWISLQMDHYPIISVESVQLDFIGGAPIDLDINWVRVMKDSGQINLVPSTGTAAIYYGAYTFFTPSQLYGWSSADHVPLSFKVGYTAGFSKVPADIKDAIGKHAAIAVLHIAGDLVNGAGVAEKHLAIDGVMSRLKTTQSPTNAGYGARIIQYKKELKELMPILRAHYKGIPSVVA